MCRRMKRQKFEKRKYLSNFGVAFVCAPTPLHFDPSEWNWMLYFCACHWERTDSHLMDVIPIETSMGIAVSGSSHTESAQIKNTFHWNVSQFLRSSTSFCCCFFGFLFCHFYSSCLILLIFNDWKDEHNRMRFTMTKWTKRFARNSHLAFLLKLGRGQNEK